MHFHRRAHPLGKSLIGRTDVDGWMIVQQPCPRDTVKGRLPEPIRVTLFHMTILDFYLIFS
jgi:hypothetical protein